ncbi:hypothetical protein ACWENR_27280, partial [Micromonospora sp. NPDC004336]
MYADPPADGADALDWLAFEQAGVVTTAQATRSLTEIDGAHHMDVRHWAADMRRQNDVWTSGKEEDRAGDADPQVGGEGHEADDHRAQGRADLR